MLSDKPAIETFGLGKRYGRKTNFALKNLNLSIMPGEVYGFLGPNGAGKSTTIKLLMNFIQPTEGHAHVMGMDVVEDSVAIKRHAGYLPGEFSYYPSLTGRQFLDYMADLAAARGSKPATGLASRFDVPLDTKLRQLSKGNRQKIGIIQAFATRPQILILDEPTSGLDPLMQELFFELVLEAKARGATVFFSSHNLSEVQKICDRVGFIKDGEMIAQQSIAELATSAVQTYEITFAEAVPLKDMKKITGLSVLAEAPRHITVRLKGELKPLLSLLAKHKVTSVSRRESELEDEFLNFYRSKK